MSILSNAHNFQIQGGEFHNNVQNIHHGPTGIDTLLAASAPDAAVDSRARQYAPSCFPGTREQYITDITDWATATATAQVPPIYWIKGPAGVGKSALAQSCAENVKITGQLGAAFFFSTNGGNNPGHLIPTLAYQLSTVLPDYRQIVNDRIQNDRTLVEKKLASQFQSLIVEPLRELENGGKGVQRKVIFIDGLDECSSKESQVEFIKIIGASVQNKSTPFRWAFFSRPEPQIVTAFDDEHISVLSHCVDLPISRNADRDIELYLRATFKNILRRRKLTYLSSTWPSDKDINRLIRASAGLFAYSAAVLRFIDHHSEAGFMETLQAVLDAIEHPRDPRSLSPFAILDAFYMLIMQRISEDVLPSVCLLLACITVDDFGGWLPVSTYCNVLGLSQIDFRSIVNALHAVMTYQEWLEHPTFDSAIDTTRSCFDQDQPFEARFSLQHHLRFAHGFLRFHHKSFYDFLIDPARSSNFCVTTPAIREKLFVLYIQRHHHFARTYSIQGTSMSTSLVLASHLSSIPALVTTPDSSSSVSLSWPQRSEFEDSFLKLHVFNWISKRLSHDHPLVLRLLQDITLKFPPTLAELDYRKSLMSDMMLSRDGLFLSIPAFGFQQAAISRRFSGTIFTSFQPVMYSIFDPVAFLRAVKKMENLAIIKPYHHRLSSIFTSAYNSIPRLKPSFKTIGQYQLGHGEKSVIWYWEFDTQKQYFHQFRTLNFLEAKNDYDTDKFKIWEESWISPC